MVCFSSVGRPGSEGQGVVGDLLGYVQDATLLDNVGNIHGNRSTRVPHAVAATGEIAISIKGALLDEPSGMSGSILAAMVLHLRAV